MKQVIVIKLDGIYYGIDVDIVQEVVYSYAERSLPEAPNFIEGLAYVRDQLLPIVRTKRLFDSPFFDLYGNKKVLVLSFERMKGKKIVSDTSSVGIIIDDVIGIESYEDSDLHPVPSVYTTHISEDIAAFIKRRGVDIALLNISHFFLDHQGHFKYQKYIHKNNDNESYSITPEDIMAIEHSIKGQFIFNQLTKKPIFIYLSRLASFEKTSIVNILKAKPDFFKHNIHSKKKEGRESFFQNAPDMYVMLEYFISHLQQSNMLKILVIDNKESSTSASLVLLLDSLKKGKINYQVNHFITDGLESDISFVYSKNMLVKITPEIQNKYFISDANTDEYTLKQIYSSKIHFYSGNLMDIANSKEAFHLIYAPNFLVENIDHLSDYIKILSNMVPKSGILILGLFEDIEDFAKSFKKYYIKSRLVFVKA